MISNHVLSCIRVVISIVFISQIPAGIRKLMMTIVTDFLTELQQVLALCCHLIYVLP